MKPKYIINAEIQAEVDLSAAETSRLCEQEEQLRFAKRVRQLKVVPIPYYPDIEA